ncbi:MAG: ATP-dependent metallopeptidase FtsH/Yme1/Tma family protein, partial [Dehalococcoidales bacterium]|nr:ATP-dependent metallopeptidase FtsH/Yme1/Tma family protein [Dehalococcoidales bacterium]
YVLIVMAVIAFFTFSSLGNEKPSDIPFSQVIDMSQEGTIKDIAVDGNILNITDMNGSKYRAIKESGVSIYEIPELNLAGVTVDIVEGGINWGSLFINFLPLLLFGGLIFFMFSQARGANSQAMSFGRSKARLFSASKPSVTFADVAGADEAKQEMYEIVEFLKNREKFQTLGARVPKGALLVGAPGTGKTLLAKAIAGEAGVPFFSISGSEFVEMFVGVGASRVRDLFEQAKRNAPSLIFIDEIDAVGRQRGAGVGGGHDEREQTLNQILVEMDGFDTNTSVIVIAATNRPDILDTALLRPGRFDRRIVLDMPDIHGREAILKIHSTGKPLDKDISLESMAKQTVGFSGADLANLVNEAAILAARRDKKTIGQKEFEESIDRVIAGPERKSRRISAREKEVIAYHEAGHALVARLLPNADPVHKISIVARGMSLGHTRQLPAEDRYIETFSQYKDRLATLFGGRVAEEIAFGELSTGASNDIKVATDLAVKMVTQYGMSSKLGPRTYGERQDMIFLGREITEQRNYGDTIADVIDQEVNDIINEAYDTAKRILTENRERLDHISNLLIAKEGLEGKEMEEAFTGPMNGKGESAEIAASAAEPSVDDDVTITAEAINNNIS